MKKVVICISILFASVVMFAQKTADNYISEAQAQLKANNYKDAVTALQLAIQKINETVVKRVVAVMPTDVNGYKAADEEVAADEEGTAVVAGGLSVSRSYAKPSASGAKSEGFASLTRPYFTIVVVGNALIVSAVNMALTNPQLQNAQGMELMTVGTRKGVFQKKEDDDKSFVFQLPLSASLIAVNGFNIPEAEFKAIIAKINFDAIAKSLSE